MKQLWVKKYQPKSFADFVFPDSKIKLAVKQLLESGNIPHLLLVGQPGSGKSTLARLLIEFNNIDPMDVLTVDASLENNVDVVRDKISSFVTTSGWGGVKVVLLEEFDHMSTQAQSTLREMMVRYSDDARFILTANYEHKIIDAIKSRCQTYTFSGMTEVSALKRAIAILEAEGIKYDGDDVVEIVRSTLPDFRKTINTLEKFSVGGELGYAHVISNTLAEMIGAGDFEGALDWVIHKAVPGELPGLYTSVFRTVVENPSVFANQDQFDRALMGIAKYMDQSTTSADQTVCFAAMIAELRQISRGKL
jgi:DNA polymerase III delta prime subunit